MSKTPKPVSEAPLTDPVAVSPVEVYNAIKKMRLTYTTLKPASKKPKTAAKKATKGSKLKSNRPVRLVRSAPKQVAPLLVNPGETITVAALSVESGLLLTDAVIIGTGVSLRKQIAERYHTEASKYPSITVEQQKVLDLLRGEFQTRTRKSKPLDKRIKIQTKDLWCLASLPSTRGKRFAMCRRIHGLSNADMAKIIGLEARDLSNYESGVAGQSNGAKNIIEGAIEYAWLLMGVDLRWANYGHICPRHMDPIAFPFPEWEGTLTNFAPAWLRPWLYASWECLAVWDAIKQQESRTSTGRCIQHEGRLPPQVEKRFLEAWNNKHDQVPVVPWPWWFTVGSFLPWLFEAFPYQSSHDPGYPVIMTASSHRVLQAAITHYLMHEPGGAQSKTLMAEMRSIGHSIFAAPDGGQPPSGEEILKAHARLSMPVWSTYGAVLAPSGSMADTPKRKPGRPKEG